ncbi:MAG: hypothetical protein IT245_05995 [Bacteroidia bacterium]|nr:hypothetical protein [Bacteroidia bacterium]
MPVVAQAGKIYTEVPVLTHLPLGEQEDTFGFNLVEHLPKLVYKSILDGRIILWDSPKKNIAISPEALKNIESNNQVSFASTQNLFLNELWTSSRRKTEFVIIGISFLSESSKGKISFGYIDLKEALPVLGREFIPCNVNGPAQLTYINALFSRRYYFNVLQFGNKDFSVNPSASFSIKKDAFYSKKKVQGLYIIPQTKLVTYVIEKNLAEINDPGTDCMHSIEKYLNDNKEVLFNLGGDKYFDYKKPVTQVTVTRIEITEIWEKKGSLIVYRPFQIRIFANNRPLNTITFEELAKWQILINFKTMEDILQEKSFQYSLYKINKDLIAYTESSLYLKALKEYKWTQVSNYVKYSRN